MNDKVSPVYTQFRLKRGSVLAQLKTIDNLMRVERWFDADDINWGHVGSLAHVQESLEEIINFLRAQDDEV